MAMTLDEIRELIHLVTETGVAELEVQHGEDRVRIRRAYAASHDVVLAPQPGSQVMAAAPPPPPPAPSSANPGEAPKSAADPSLFLVKSPIVGTFYESSSPGTPPFV